MEHQPQEGREPSSSITPIVPSNPSSPFGSPTYDATLTSSGAPPPTFNESAQPRAEAPRTDAPPPPPPPHMYYQPQPIYVTQQVQMAPSHVIAVVPKSMAASVLLTLFFGPLGLFYASVTGGVVMTILSIVVGIGTLGVGLLLTGPACIVWAVVATNNYNARAMAGAQHYSQNAR
jgi:hypothetical protein